MDVGRDTKMKAETDIYAVQRKLCIVANGWPGASLPFVHKRGTAARGWRAWSAIRLCFTDFQARGPEGEATMKVRYPTSSVLELSPSRDVQAEGLPGSFCSGFLNSLGQC